MSSRAFSRSWLSVFSRPLPADLCPIAARLPQHRRAADRAIGVGYTNDACSHVRRQRFGCLPGPPTERESCYANFPD